MRSILFAVFAAIVGMTAAQVPRACIEFTTDGHTMAVIACPAADVCDAEISSTLTSGNTTVVTTVGVSESIVPTRLILT